MTTATVTIVIPYPHPALSPNSRMDRRAAARHRRRARGDAQIAAMEAGAKRLSEASRITYRLTAHPTTNRRRDADNLVASCKSALDGIAAYIGVDDSRWTLAGVTFAAPSRPARVLIMMEAMT
jgi:crossover junction endodeoxyribonuclease RusA